MDEPVRELKDMLADLEYCQACSPSDATMLILAHQRKVQKEHRR